MKRKKVKPNHPWRTISFAKRDTSRIIPIHARMGVRANEH